ncbi:MAG: InlB B-repeat-containing protein, partial [Kiritimatiellaeota bacterium]|nr:InlB B-repeat-containing protein [Kiritimatiellota bacterium]
MKYRLCLILSILGFVATVARATTHYVHEGESLQAAIDGAAPGDEIVVEDGVYAPIVSANLAIVIRSENGAGATFIDGGGTDRCATLGAGNGETETVLVGFTLQNGYADHGGGAAYGTLEQCAVTGNRAAGNGAGAYHSTLVNCVLSANMAYGEGGGVYRGVLKNCTVSENMAFSGGGTAYGTLYNCIVWGNRDGSGGVNNWLFDTFYYSCTESLPFGGSHNITSDPQFVNPAQGDFRLQATSPCIDAGNNAVVDWDCDFDGAARIQVQGGTVDMGAYEVAILKVTLRWEEGAFGTLVSPRSVLCTNVYSALPVTGTLSNHVFVGWTNSVGTVVTNGMTLAAGEATLHAQWGREVVVSFDGNRGTPTNQVVRQGLGGGYVLPPSTPTLVDHQFTGWFTEKTNGVKVTAATLVMNDTNHTLWAQWTNEFKVAVTFVANNGTTTNQLTVQDYGKAYALPDDPVREEHFFLGWFANTNTTGAPLIELSKVTTNAIFYAGWATNNAMPTVYAFADGPGRVTVSSTNKQGQVTLTATANANAAFVDWQPDGNTKTSFAVTPTTNAVYVARFRDKSAGSAIPEITGATESAYRMVGMPFEMRFEVNDAAKPVKFSAKNMPPGLKINATT